MAFEGAASPHPVLLPCCWMTAWIDCNLRGVAISDQQAVGIQSRHAFTPLHCCIVTCVLLLLPHIIALSVCFFTLPKLDDICGIVAMTVANRCRQGKYVLRIRNYF